MAKIRSKSYWYDYVDINLSLTQKSSTRATYRVFEAASQDNLHTLQRVNQALTSLEQDPLLNAVVIPINLGNVLSGVYSGSHWVGLVVRRTIENTLEAFYNDSLGTPMNSSLPNLRQMLENHRITHITDFQQRQQFNGYDCGPWTIFNLDSLARTGKLPTDISQQDIIDQRNHLSIISNSDTTELPSVVTQQRSSITKTDSLTTKSTESDTSILKPASIGEVSYIADIVAKKNEQNLIDKSSEAKQNPLAENNSGVAIYLIDEIKKHAPYLTQDERLEVIKILYKLMQEQAIRPSIIQDAIELTFPDKFEYSKVNKFFNYAFPEGKISVLDYKDLYESGYYSTTMNLLMQDIRKKFQSANVHDTKILLLNAPSCDLLPFNNLALYLDQELKKSLSGNNLSNIKEKKAVIIFPFIYQCHWYSAVIHINKQDESIIDIKAILNNPYGVIHFEESTKTAITDQIKILLSSHFGKKTINFSVLPNPEDIQGAYYDNNNCGPITVYNIEHYVQHAFNNSKIEEYKVPLPFDKFQDQKLNKSVHESFLLRLKADQIARTGNGKLDLCYWISPTKTGSVPGRPENAQKSAKELLTRIQTAACEHYGQLTDFFKDKPNDKSTIPEKNFLELSHSEQMELLKRITQMVINASSPPYIINKPPFAEALKQIVDVFKKQDNSGITDEIHKKLDEYLVPSLSFFLQSLFGEQFGNSALVETELIKIVKSGNRTKYLKFFQPLTQEQTRKIINIQDQSGKTALIYAVQRGDEVIVSDLISKGADLELKCYMHQMGSQISHMELDALSMSAFEANSIEILSYLINQIRTKPNFGDKLTALLRDAFANWDHNNDKFQTEHLDGIYMQRNQVVNLLLAEGADPFDSITFGMIVSSKPSIVAIFLMYFPEKVETTLLAAIGVKNLELVNGIVTSGNYQPNGIAYICTKFSYNVNHEAIEKGLKLIEYMLQAEPHEQQQKQYTLPFQYSDPSLNSSKRIATTQLEKMKYCLEQRDVQNLQLAAQNGNSHLQTPILKNPHTLLIEAAKKGNIAEVQQLIGCGQIKNINMYDESGLNALLWAGQYKHFQVVEFLIEQGASINVLSKNKYMAGYTLATFAILNEDCKILEYLLNTKRIFPDSNVPDPANEASLSLPFLALFPKISLLVLASQHEKIASLQMLLKVATSNALIQETLKDSARLGKLASVKVLTQNELAAKQLIDESKALVYAAANGHIDIVQEFITKGAEINIAYDCLGTPLMSAARRGYLDVMKALIEHGAKLDAVIIHHSFFDRKESVSYHRYIVDFDRKTDLSKESYVTTALTEALSSYNANATILLIESGATIDPIWMNYIHKRNLQEALFEATKADKQSTVAKILSTLKNYPEEKQCKNKVFKISVKEGNVAIVNMLINEIEFQELYSNILCDSIVAKTNNAAILQLILNQKATEHLPPYYFKRALEEAKSKESEELVGLLIKHLPKTFCEDYGHKELLAEILCWAYDLGTVDLAKSVLQILVEKTPNLVSWAQYHNTKLIVVLTDEVFSAEINHIYKYNGSVQSLSRNLQSSKSQLQLSGRKKIKLDDEYIQDEKDKISINKKIKHIHEQVDSLLADERDLDSLNIEHQFLQVELSGNVSE